MAELADDAKIIETVVRAHFDTCDYTEEKIKPFIAKAKAEKQFTQCGGMVSQYHNITFSSTSQPNFPLLSSCLLIDQNQFPKVYNFVSL